MEWICYERANMGYIRTILVDKGYIMKKYFDLFRDYFDQFIIKELCFTLGYSGIILDSVLYKLGYSGIILFWII